MNDLREFPHAARPPHPGPPHPGPPQPGPPQPGPPHPGAPHPVMPPAAPFPVMPPPGRPYPPGPPFPSVPPPRWGDTPPAGLPYGYGPPTAAGPHPFGTAPMPGPIPPAPPRRRGRTALIAVLLSVLILGGVVSAVALMARSVALSPPTTPAPSSGPVAPAAPSVPTSHHTLNTMFAGNGTCTPTTAAEQIPSTTQGLVCTGRGDGTVFVFYQYTGGADAFRTTMVRGWGGTGLTPVSEDACTAKYTGTVDVPGVGTSPVVVDIYRRSPFVAVSMSGNGAGVDTLTTPRYQVADRGALCSGG